MNVKVIRMSSGEDIVADVMETKEDSLVLMNAIVAVPAGNGQLGFAPYAPLLNRDQKELEINRKWVIYVADVNDDLVEQYEEMFSPITTPSKKLIL